MTIPAHLSRRLWISSSELAELAPISRRKIAELARSGVLRGRIEGSEWWIESDSAWEWLGARPQEEKLRPNVARMLGRSA